ncbi:MAG: carboxypeptidase regulatory-like domain-containing protein [Beijerinckiaceae bacterium]|jgi:hypothetical protein|nr:carboxypeptidase regulatory-like domain-containing protein [Beijerinckiaceae bacterium]
MRPFFAICTTLLISACAQLPPPDVAFDPKQAGFIHAEGKGTIKGHAFLTSRNGKVHMAAGETIRLIPATDYARKRFAALYPHGMFTPALQSRTMEMDAAYLANTRVTKAESNGRFTFEKVAPGTYYLATQRVWTDARSQSVEGGAFYEIVTLTGRETEPVTVVMSGR